MCTREPGSSPRGRFPRRTPGRRIPGAEHAPGRGSREQPVPPARCHGLGKRHTPGPGCGNTGAGHSRGTRVKTWPEPFLPGGLRRLFRRQTIAHKQVSKLTIGKTRCWVVFPLRGVPARHRRTFLVFPGCKMVPGTVSGTGTPSMATAQLGPQHPRLSWCFPRCAGPLCAPSSALSPRCHAGAGGSDTARAEPAQPDSVHRRAGHWASPTGSGDRRCPP